MCPPGYHHNGFVATHALGHMMYGCIYIYTTLCVLWITYDHLYTYCCRYGDKIKMKNSRRLKKLQEKAIRISFLPLNVVSARNQ